MREVIGRRVARLPEPGRCLLEAGAALGMEFEPLVLTTAEQVVYGLAAAVGAGLLTQVGEHRYAFPHALIAETVPADMSPSRRAGMHLRIADVLAEQRGHAGEIAKHVRAAGACAPPERRIAAELAAARQAEAALAYADAAGHYEVALDAGAPDRATVLLALGAAHDRAGSRARAEAAFGEVVELARAAADPLLLAAAALGRGGVGVLVAATDPSITRPLEEALAALPEHERAVAARLRARLAIEFYYSDPARTEELSARAVDDARASGDASALAAALNARRVALWTPEHIEERLEISTEMIEAAAAAGDRETAAALGDRDAAEILYARLEPHARLFPVVARGGIRIGSIEFFIAGLAHALGRTDEAEQRMRRAIAVNLRIGAHPRATIAQARLGELLLERG